MRDVTAELKALRLYGMTTVPGPILLHKGASPRWILRVG